MRYLVLSDLHANLEALSAVLEDAGKRGYDRVVALGDLVGYGGNPNEVVETVRSLEPEAVVRGNHDKVVAGITEADHFNDVARAAALWTRTVMTPDNEQYLRALPEGPVVVGDMVLSHGSPADEEDYILSDLDAVHNLEAVDFALAFFGHTHFTCVFSLGADRLSMRVIKESDPPLHLVAGERYLVNPGSIGQPRDHNPKASYAIYDSAARTITFPRVDYDVDAAQRSITGAGLPGVLAQRLALGV